MKSISMAFRRARIRSTSPGPCQYCGYTSWGTLRGNDGIATRFSSGWHAITATGVRWDANGEPIPAGWNYFPSLGETFITIGMAAIGIAVFILVSRLFPVVVVEDVRTHTPVGAKSAAAS